MTSENFKAAAKWAFWPEKKHMVSFFVQGALLVLLLALLNGMEELGVPSELLWLRWVGAGVILVLEHFLWWRMGERKFCNLDIPGWGWIGVGLLLGALLLRLGLLLLPGEYQRLSFLSNFVFLFTPVAVLVWLSFTARHFNEVKPKFPN